MKKNVLFLNFYFEKLKDIWYLVRRKKELFPVEEGIQFIHHHPLIFNIGDYLCSPRHYFKFEKPINDLTIVGGGVFAGFAMKRLRRNNINFRNTVVWGIGESNVNLVEKSEKILDLPFLEWGIRDINRVDIDHFLPCVSCLHPMLNNKASIQGTVVFFERRS